ncbi:DUF6141 family protein [Pontibacter silvestris]|uniref:DUF6141 family protein n=1 Tax=Pontibacter silvestris TaxID=2305183 RepID=A0ABW4X323_9BACT|nr:DUF6141 family protein [Pontibacter silvestris]MCC9137963.1 DUF6141 family protein [Pontibacter silvestris]
MAETVLFQEKQRFRQLGLWTVVLAFAAIFWVGFVYQVLLSGTYGNNPVSDVELSVVFAVVGVYLPLFFYKMNLTTEVLPGMLQVYFSPFHLNPVRVPLRLVRTYEKVVYSPIGDYGGWGIRWGRKGKAYNMSGNEGVELLFYNKKPLLIGSQRAHELYQAIRQAKEMKSEIGS